MSKRFRLDWHGHRVEAMMAGAQAEGTLEAALFLLAESNDRVPLETGRLRESGQVTTDPSGKAAVSYSDPNAVRQHEDAYYKHDPGRTRKFLEIPMLARRPEMLDRVAEPIRRRLRR